MSEPQTPTSRRPGRTFLVGIAIVVPLVPIVIALLLSGSGGQQTAVRTNATIVPAHKLAPAAATRATAPPPGPPDVKLPSGSGTLVALVVHPTGLHARPGGHVIARLTTKTEFGSPQALWVARRSGRWLGVVSPKAGNNHVGWIPASAASLSRVAWELKVSLSARKLTVLDKGEVKQRYTVAIGAPDAPTPTGRFAVTDRLLTGNPAGPYGCCILALSAKAPHVIQGWSGGNRIAIHSTPESETIGEAVSHGCVRLTLAEGRWLINHVPLGTPTLITS
ncbi:MAG: L,D-transpeptidase [Solirubrobacteraceae bacterium]